MSLYFVIFLSLNSLQCLYLYQFSLYKLFSMSLSFGIIQHVRSVRGAVAASINGDEVSFSISQARTFCWLVMLSVLISDCIWREKILYWQSWQCWYCWHCWHYRHFWPIGHVDNVDNVANVDNVDNVDRVDNVDNIDNDDNVDNTDIGENV